MPAITPDDLERATWLSYIHGCASDHSLCVFRCSLSSRFTKEFKIYRVGREPRLEGPKPLNDIVYKIDGVIVDYDPDRICERLNAQGAPDMLCEYGMNPMSLGESRERCLVIGPFGSPGSDQRVHADMFLQYIVKAALCGDQLEYDVKRADEEPSPGMISDHIINEILNSELVVADLTFLNPNVFYEIALRHMAEKPIIHMAANGTQLPFDNFGYRAIMFDIITVQGHEKAQADLRLAITEVRKPSYKVSNPVTQARGFAKMATSADSTERMVASLAGQVANLRSTMMSFQSPQHSSATASVMVPVSGLESPLPAAEDQCIRARTALEKATQHKRIAEAFMANSTADGEP